MSGKAFREIALLWDRVITFRAVIEQSATRSRKVSREVVKGIINQNEVSDSKCDISKIWFKANAGQGRLKARLIAGRSDDVRSQEVRS